MLFGQFVHTVALLAPTTLEYVLTRQLTHAAAELAPTVSEYVPAVHFEDALTPAVIEYSPAGHEVQTVEEVAVATLEY